MIWDGPMWVVMAVPFTELTILIGKPAVIEKLNIRMKSGVKGEKWKLMEGVWRARTPYAQYQWGEYAVEPADQEAVQIIENLYGEK